MNNKNTKIEYLYRDADNYKTYNSYVVSGEITEKQIKTIINCLSEGEYFIPADVGLPEIRNFGYEQEVDHVWFELSNCGFSITSEAPTEDMTVADLVSAFENAKWDEAAAYERLIN